MRVSAIDNPDRFEDVSDPGCMQEVPENNLANEISMVRPVKTAKIAYFGLQ